eukprot:11224384-Lingulodinium_polyedra.AAC.1
MLGSVSRNSHLEGRRASEPSLSALRLQGRPRRARKRAARERAGMSPARAGSRRGPRRAGKDQGARPEHHDPPQTAPPEGRPDQQPTKNAVCPSSRRPTRKEKRT